MISSYENEITIGKARKHKHNVDIWFVLALTFQR